MDMAAATGDQLPPEEAQQRATLADVLQGPPAIYILGSLPKCLLVTARLACKALRDAVDDNPPGLQLRVKKEDLQLAEKGQVPSLSRWPNASAITLSTRAQDNGALTEALLALPFLGLEPHVTARVKQLQVEVRNYHSTPFRYPYGSSVIQLAFYMPNLRKVDLSRLMGISVCWVQQQRLYDGLRRLVRMESLILPRGRALEGVQALSGSSRLRHLAVITMNITSNDDPLSRQALDGLVQLRQVTCLDLSSCAFCVIPDVGKSSNSSAAIADTTVSFLELLNRLPETVEKVEVPLTCISFQHGRVTEIDLRNDGLGYLQPSFLTDIKQLLASRAMQSADRLLLRIDALEIQVGQAVNTPGLQLLAALARCSEQVRLKKLEATCQAAMWALEVFGPPDKIKLWLPGGDTITMQLVPEETRQQQQQQQHQGQPSSLPVAADPPSTLSLLTETEVAQMVVERLVAASGRREGVLHLISAAAASGANRSVAAVRGSPRTCYPALLIRGGHMVDMARASSEGGAQAGALKEFMRELADSFDSSCEPTGMLKCAIRGYQVLPASWAVLVECVEDVEAAAAIVVAVEAKAADLPAGALEVTPVAATCNCIGDYLGPPMRDTYLAALTELLQGFWDGRNAGGGGGGGMSKEDERALLGELIVTAGRLAKLPREVRWSSQGFR